MAIELEGLEFQLEAKTSEGVKGVEALAKSLETLKKAVSGKNNLGKTTKSIESLDKALSGFHTDKLDGLTRALQGFQNLGACKISATVPKRINEIAEAADNISLSGLEKLEDMTKALRELRDLRLPNRINIPSIQTVNPATGSSASQESGTEAVNSGVEQVNAGTEKAISGVQRLKNALASVGGVFKKGFTGIGGKLKTLGSKLTSTANAGKKFANVMMFIPKTLGSHLAAKVKQTTAGLGNLLSSFKRIAMYRAVRAAIAALTQGFKEGIANLYQYSLLMGGQFSKSMDRLATSSQYLKNSLGAMAAPLINALAPAIDFVIDKIVTLINWINMLFARLSGRSTTTVAKKVATSFADAADTASGAAKELKKSILGFDELNVMADNSAGGGGGGKDTPDYGDMFEEVPIDSAVGDFANKLKEAFENQDWKELGTLLGNKVNEIIDGIDWAGVGEKIGKAIDGAVKTAYWFLDTVDFYGIGKHLADLLNNALEEIDWEFVGRLLVKPLTSLADLIIGFVTNTDWGLVARSLSDAIKGVFDECTEWLRSYDWKELGEWLWQAIKDVVTNIDWGGIAKSMFTFLGTAIRSAAQFLVGFFGSIGADIKKWWDNDIKGVDWKDTAGNLLKAIGKGFCNIGEWVWSNIVDPFCSALLGEDTWADVKKVGANIISGLWQGIKDTFTNVKNWIKEHIVDPIVNGFKDLFGIHSLSTVMAEIGEFIGERLLEGILKPLKNITRWIDKNIFTPIKNAFEKLGLEIQAYVELAKEGWETLTDWVGEIGEKTVKLAKDGWRTLTTWAGEIGTKAVGLVQDGWDTLRNWVGDIGDKAFGLAKDGWDTIRNWTGEIGSKAYSLARDGWDTIRNWTGEIGSKAFALAKDGWSTVSNFVGNIGSKAFSLAKDGWTSVSNFVGNIGSKAFSLAKDGWSTVSSYVGNIGSKAFSLAKDGWSTISNWAGEIGSKAVSLTKSGWSTLSSWAGDIGSKAVSLTKSGWTSLSSWVGSSVSAAVSLYKSGWSSISNFVGTTVSVGISLFKSGWSSIKSFFGLSSGGTVGANGGVKFFSNANGGAYDRGIPLFGNGTNGVNHGTMFVAGEKGAEMVGHLNGRTEVMNRFQLASVMKTSVVEGMARYANYLTAITNHMTTCTNATVTAILYSANNVLSAVNGKALTVGEDYIAWMDALSERMTDGGDGSSEQIAEGIRAGLYETTSRQNELLREQNELLRQILEKDTTVEVTTNSFTKALNRKNQRDGKVIVPVGV